MVQDLGITIEKHEGQFHVVRSILYTKLNVISKRFYTKHNDRVPAHVEWVKPKHALKPVELVDIAITHREAEQYMHYMTKGE